MSKDVVNLVLNLIELSANPNENEARNAAVKACELIRKHKLVILECSTPQDVLTPDFGEWETEDLAAHHKYQKKT